VALLTTPLLVTGTLLVLSLTSRDFLPLIYTTDDKAFVLQFGVVVGLLVGIFEELGWTGFAIPTLRRRNGILTTGLIVGFAEGAWHLLVVIWTNGDSMGGISPILFLPAVLFTWLPAYRVLMVYVYDRTESLLVAILMHTSLIAFWYILTPHVLTALPLVVYYLVFTAAVWVVVAALSGMRTLPRRESSSIPVQG
jgi:membrane protease YdiL (CAAX protease family)